MADGTSSSVSFSSDSSVSLPAGTAPVLDANWQQWIAENSLLGCHPDSIVDQLVQTGLSREAARTELDRLQQSPVYRAVENFLSLKSKLESVLDNQQAVWEAAADYRVIGRRCQLTCEQFFREHYLTSRPVIVTDVCRDWPALQRWQLDQLAERFAECEVEIQAERDRDALYELNSIQHKTRVRFADFMQQVCAEGPNNNFYMTANNHVFRNPTFASLRDDIGSMPPYLDPTQLGQRAHLWIGPEGTRTPLHHDTCMLLHVQIVGRKRWRLVSPLQTHRIYNHRAVFSPVDLDNVDLQRFPRMKDVQILEAIVEPGEALFLPLAWWHQVTSLEPCVSLSLTNLAFPNDFTYSSPNVQNW